MGEPGSNSGSGSGGAEDEGGTSQGTCTPKFSTDALDPAVVATMTADELKKFIDTGRTGRRNALPDVSNTVAASTSAGFSIFIIFLMIYIFIKL